MADRDEIDLSRMDIIRLSPSRINEYQQCPKLYHYRVIEKLPEPLSLDAIRGTLVHNILEELLALPTGSRTLEMAQANIEKHWIKLKDEHSELSQLVTSEIEWVDRVKSLLTSYFQLENPQSFQPTHMESHLELQPTGNIQLHGYVDRIDVATTGEVRIVDYKTGKSPRSGYEEKALFQLRFYALLWWRLHDEVPKLLQLLYLGDQRSLKSTPSIKDLERTEEKTYQIGDDIKTSLTKDYWPTQKSKLCDWCSFKSICPAFK